MYVSIAICRSDGLTQSMSPQGTAAALLLSGSSLSRADLVLSDEGAASLAGAAGVCRRLGAVLAAAVSRGERRQHPGRAAAGRQEVLLPRAGTAWTGIRTGIRRKHPMSTTIY